MATSGASGPCKLEGRKEAGPEAEQELGAVRGVGAPGVRCPALTVPAAT